MSNAYDTCWSVGIPERLIPFPPTFSCFLSKHQFPPLPPKETGLNDQSLSKQSVTSLSTQNCAACWVHSTGGPGFCCLEDRSKVGSSQFLPGWWWGIRRMLMGPWTVLSISYVWSSPNVSSSSGLQWLSVHWQHTVFLSVLKVHSLLPPSHCSEWKGCEGQSV